ncbi:glycosyl hydrolase [Miniimonas arenae]|uniref:Glycosyl hydrolase n=1 Tax=Miniimonas arenae TaxID=676201 RepID=A0A5C5BD82_9MICO|nr:glycosyl hydrolase [Miniimonas arenae]
MTTTQTTTQTTNERTALDLLTTMTLEQKVAQLIGYWIDRGEEVVAPMAGEMATSSAYEDVTRHGVGHLTRVYGTRPVDPVERARWLWAEQRRLRERSGHGIPALVHEECLTGLAAWRAATFPTPLAWGASFDPEIVERMGALIGESMRSLGVHQGLAPVLDVIRDPRWGRVDECIGEDPYLVGTVGTAYVRGLQSAGVHATLKHFVGYSASRAGRNHAPVSIGPRELADVFLPPFEMAVRDGGAHSVMNSYSDLDGVPAAASRALFTDLLREQWGFDGVVVSDYFAVAFLQLMHGVATSPAEAAALALTAGIDVELPTGDAYLALVDAVREGSLEEAVVDRAVLRVLTQKAELGLLTETFEGHGPDVVDLDPPGHRALARTLAEESVVLLANDGVLPLGSAERAPARVAVVGPNADRAAALMGCYSFVNHVLAHHPDVELGLALPTLAEALRAQLPDSEVVTALGCEVEGEDRSGFAEAAEVVASADVAVVVLGDQAGLFGRGTVGEGNDVESLELPGQQRALVAELRHTGTPLVVVLLTGRPYALAWALDGEDRPNAVLQSFFPGEEGGAAIARLLTGAASPSGRLPVSLPRAAGAQPYGYLHPVLGGPSEVTSVDPTPVRPFGFGLTYTTFARTDLTTPPTCPTDGTIAVEVTVTNTGAREGTDVVQLYARDVAASVVRPVAQLLAYQRVTLAPGASARLAFEVPTARLALTDPAWRRAVEPGTVEVWVGGSCAEREAEGRVELVGPLAPVGPASGRIARCSVSPA